MLHNSAQTSLLNKTTESSSLATFLCGLLVCSQQNLIYRITYVNVYYNLLKSSRIVYENFFLLFLQIPQRRDNLVRVTAGSGKHEIVDQISGLMLSTSHLERGDLFLKLRTQFRQLLIVFWSLRASHGMHIAYLNETV